MSKIYRCKYCKCNSDSSICSECIDKNMDWSLNPDHPEFILSESKSIERSMTLPTNSSERKDYPIMSGCINYFPAAIAGVAKISKLGNDKHNPGEPLHHARSKSMDHGDCVLRHLIDVQDLLAMSARSALTPKGIEDLLTEASSLAWRALALSQELHEKYGAPLAPGAKNE